jgi:hypothetical protein
MYPSPSDWQAFVLTQMRAAKLVIVRAGRGTGLHWELRQAALVVDPIRFVILVNRMSERDYNEFQKQAYGYLPVTLPELDSDDLSGFIVFSSTWKAKFCSFLKSSSPVETSFIQRWRTRLENNRFRPLRARMTFALKPVFEQSGVEWRKPSWLGSGVTLPWVLLLLYPVLHLILLFCGY